MTTLHTEDAARRLAQAILADIKLYNEEKIVTGESLDEELGEGVALFRSRVTPELHHVWDHCIANEWQPMIAKRRARKPEAHDPFAAYPAAQASQAPTPQKAPGVGNDAMVGVMWMAFGMAGLGGVLAWYLLR